MTDLSDYHNPNHPHGFAPTPRWDTIPQYMKDRCRWCVWRARPKASGNGYDKLPFNAVDGPVLTKSKPQQWLTFEQARQLYENAPGEFNGVGILIPQKGAQATIDEGLDDVDLVIGDIDKSTDWPEAWPDTYVEFSPSMNGLRALWHCPDGVDRDVQKPHELYAGNTKGAYVTITGLRVGGRPEDIQQVNGELQEWAEQVKPNAARVDVTVGLRPDPAWSGSGEMPVIRDVGVEGTRSDKVFGIICGFLQHRRSPEEVYQILVNSDASWQYYLSKRRGDPVKACDRAWSDVCKVAAEVQVPELPAVVMQGLDDQGHTVPVKAPVEPVGVEVFDLKLVFPLGDALLLDKAFQDLWLTIYSGQDYTWNPNKACYERQERKWLEKLITRFITQCSNEDGHRGNPTVALVSGVANYVRAHVPTIPSGTAPCWMPGVNGPDPDKVILFRNGVLDIETRQFIPPAPELFAINALPHTYDPAAPEPTRWVRFLDELWPTRPESKDLLQEMMGSIIAGDMRYQKLMVLIGPPRAGKGTIGRLLKAMVGTWNFASTSINDIGASGSAESLIGKRLWLMADTKVASKDQARGLEVLLAITGRDPMSIPRKYIEHWTGTLDCQPVMMANSMPRFYEPTGAIASRLLPLGFHETFAGREDTGLDAKLLGEMSGILLWALAGYERLKVRGRYTVTQDEIDMREDFDSVTNPLAGFLEDVVEPAPGYQLPSKQLWRAWEVYRKEHGIEMAKSMQQFFGMLKEATRTRSVQKMVHGRRARQWEGLKFRDVVDAEILHAVELDAEK